MANVIGIWEDALNVQKSLPKNGTILVVVQVHTLCQSDGLRLSVYLYTQFSLKRCSVSLEILISCIRQLWN